MRTLDPEDMASVREAAPIRERAMAENLLWLVERHFDPSPFGEPSNQIQGVEQERPVQIARLLWTQGWAEPGLHSADDRTLGKENQLLHGESSASRNVIL